jgi:hypothetical protein
LEKKKFTLNPKKEKIHKFGIKIRKSKESIFNTNTINKYINSELKIRKIVVNVYKDWKRKCTVNPKREEYAPLGNSHINLKRKGYAPSDN